MKKILSLFLLVVLFTLSFAACGKKTDTDASGEASASLPAPADDPFAEQKQILSLFESFTVAGSSGFDYSSEQTQGNTVVNRHTVSVRLDSSNGSGSRVEYKKNLNEDLSGDQYTELESTTYYQNGKIAVRENGVWTWKSGTLAEFVTVNLQSFRLDYAALRDVSLTASGETKTLTFRIDDANAAAFLGVSQPIKNLSFEIKTDADCKRLVSFAMTYAQELTATVFRFTPYTGSATVTLPD